MADLNSTLNQSTVASNDFVVEPYNAPTDVLKQARKFFPQEVYNLSSQTNLYKFLLALLGDSGVGGMKKAITYARTQQALSNVHFEDLDTLFSGALSLSRQNSEIYNTIPSSSLLTDAQWLEVRSKDANYRSRANDYIKGLQYGSTETGYSLIARAATGYDSTIYEQWQYYDDIASDAPIGFPNLGKTTSRNEVVVLPQTNNLSQSQIKYLNDAFNRVKSTNNIITFSPQGSAVNNVPINQVVSSSNFFYTKKTVTGNPNLIYPGTSTTYNTWIVAGSAVEAPTYAFSNSQESIIYAPVSSSSASTTQIGPFNQIQQTIFGYLQNVPSTLTSFSSNQSYVENSQNVEISTPWVVRENTLNLFANSQYPIGYFALTNGITSTNKQFWASTENYIFDQQGNRTSESLTLNFSGSVPINLLEFEISQKPIDIQVQYLASDLQTWTTVSLNNNVENTVSVYYDNTTTYQWQPAALTFTNNTKNVIQTNSIRLNFTRRTDIFPFNNPTTFPWSIEIRNLKCGLLVGQQSDFVSFPGVDVLGNSFTTSLQVYGPGNVINNANSFWQSQSNPSQFAVESLYFDISSLQGSAQTIDQIYIDPLTIGNLMHVYYSNDDSSSGTAAFGQGDIIWSDSFSNTGLVAGEGIWASYNLAWSQNFPSFEKYVDTDAVDYFAENYASLYAINNIAGFQSAYSIGGNITANQYGQGDTIATIANPSQLNTGGIAGTVSPYFELDICLQGTSLTTGYSIQYNLNSNGLPNITLATYYNGSAINTKSVVLPTAFNKNDQIGIRNDAINNQAIGFVVQSGIINTIGTVSATGNFPSLPYGGNSYGYGTYPLANPVSILPYGYTSILAEDYTSNFSLDNVQFNKTTSTSVQAWDYKLWNPINRHYRLQKGFLSLPNPVTAKYIKLEFTKLTPTPYESVYNPLLPLVEFNAYPSWVVAYINDNFSQVTSLNQLKAETVNYNLINTGVQQPNQTLMSDPQPESILDYVNSLSNSDITKSSQQEYNSWFAPHASSKIQTPSNQNPQVYPNTLYQEDSLFNTVQNPNPLNQVYSGVNPGALSNYSQESTLGPPTVGPITARSDDTIIKEKNFPDLWFPRVCRHAYQVVQTQRDSKLAYNVAIKNIAFYLTNRSVPTNNPFYFETLADISNADNNYPNTFVQNNWYFSPSVSSLTYGLNIPIFGFENFDGVPF
jgi:hypothetical protein